MRADRLLSMLMLLQARGKITAEDLATELEVSVRTIYRDVTALGTAGVPITTARGPDGGIALLDSYRTTLTGLTDGETRALFLLSVPAALTGLGVKEDLQQALRKLAAAVPATQRDDHQRVRQRLHLDATPWRHTPESGLTLQLIQRALWADRCLALRYELAWSAQQARVVLPLGLVAKGNRWYLVCTWGDGPRVIKLASLVAARLCDEAEATGLARPEAFDLVAFWTDWCERTERNRSAFVATVRVTPQLHATFRYLYADDEIETMGQADPEGRFTVRLTMGSFEAARSRILGWGGAAKVLEPDALRESVLDFARQIVDTYGH